MLSMGALIAGRQCNDQHCVVERIHKSSKGGCQHTEHPLV